MESRNERGVVDFACGGEEVVDPFFHFFGGFIGEGDRKDAVAGDFVGVDEVGDAMGDDAGFARAGTGED